VQTDNAKITYAQNGVVRYTHTIAAGLHLWLDSAFNTIGGKARNLTFSGSGWKGDTGVPGTDGADGINGADGSTFYSWVAYADTIDGTVNFTTGNPGGRAYQGVANNKTTATESTNPTDYAWTPYTGPATFGLVSTGTCYDGPNYALKSPAGSSAWDSSVYSDESFTGGCNVSFTAGQTNAFCGMGINADPTTDGNYTSIDGMFLLDAAGVAFIYEGGTSVLAVGSYTTSTVFQIRYDGKFVYYSMDGVVKRSAPVTPGFKFFLDSSFATPGARINNISWGAAGPAGDNGADAISVSAAPDSITIQCDFAGNPKGGQLPVTSQLKAIVGTTDRTSAATYAVAATSNCSASVSTGGLITVSSISADAASVDVTISYAGVSVTKRITLSKAYDGAAGTSGSTPGVMSGNGGAWGDSGSTFRVAVGPGGTIAARASFVTVGVNTNSGTWGARIQYQADGTSTWTTIATDEESWAAGDAAHVGANGSIAGPSTLTVYTFKLQTYETATPTATIKSFAVTASWSP